MAAAEPDPVFKRPWRARLEQCLQQIWSRRGPLACLLWPLSWLHGVILQLRRQCYAQAWCRQERLPCATIVVGNVIVGGAGKTPTTLAIVSHLQARGLKVGIISRGYGRQGHDPLEVDANSDVWQAGDEPMLLQQKTKAPLAVAARRADAAQLLLHRYPHLQVLVCDDGLQHLALARDLEIVVFDERACGNGWLLPAGPLREPWPRPADLVLVTTHQATPELDEHPAVFHARRQLGPQAWRADGQSMDLQQLATHKNLTAVAAIARPQAFFDMLRASGLQLQRCIALADHDNLQAIADMDDGAPLVCTEKDAVKLWQTHPQAWAVPLQLEIPQAFFHALDQKLDRLNLQPSSANTPLNS